LSVLVGRKMRTSIEAYWYCNLLKRTSLTLIIQPNYTIDMALPFGGYIA